MAEGLQPLTPHRGRLVVCLATSASEAWALSGALRPKVDAWDLWEAHVSDTPVSRVRHWDRLVEYRIPRVILPQGVHWIGTRAGGGCV